MHRHAASVAALLWATALWMSPACAETVLHLADTETVSVAPDELAASLRAEATNADPAEAQRQVNAAIADALAHTGKVSGVTVSTGAYSVWHVGPTPQDNTERWQASQSLELKGHDSVALLTLVGLLQHNGLVVGELGWRLSREAERKAMTRRPAKPSPPCVAGRRMRPDCSTCGSGRSRRCVSTALRRCRAPASSGRWLRWRRHRRQVPWRRTCR